MCVRPTIDAVEVFIYLSCPSLGVWVGRWHQGLLHTKRTGFTIRMGPCDGGRIHSFFLLLARADKTPVPTRLTDIVS